jgi:uridine monophosphate synthetase
MKRLTYHQRAKFASHPLSKKLFLLMEKKKSNLGLAADVTDSKKLIELIHQTGPHICLLKTHIDIIKNFNPKLIVTLQSLAKRYQFLIFEDRKVADIGNTVHLQYSAGIYQISSWADMINAHILPGPGIISGLKKAGLPKKRGLILLAQMSSEKNYLTPSYTNHVVKLAKENKDFVIGFIAQKKLVDSPEFIHFTPGVQFLQKSDALGQQYLTPEKALVKNKTDIILVGRGIYQANDPALSARQYQERGWQAYLSCMKI